MRVKRLFSSQFSMARVTARTLWGSRPQSILFDPLSAYVLVHMLICDWTTDHYINRTNRKISQLSQHNRSRTNLCFEVSCLTADGKYWLTKSKVVSLQFTNSRKYLYARDEPHIFIILSKFIKINHRLGN